MSYYDLNILAICGCYICSITNDVGIPQPPLQHFIYPRLLPPLRLLEQVATFVLRPKESPLQTWACLCYFQYWVPPRAKVRTLPPTASVSAPRPSIIDNKVRLVMPLAISGSTEAPWRWSASAFNLNMSATIRKSPTAKHHETPLPEQFHNWRTGHWLNPRRHTPRLRLENSIPAQIAQQASVKSS